MANQCHLYSYPIISDFSIHVYHCYFGYLHMGRIEANKLLVIIIKIY